MTRWKKSLRSGTNTDCVEVAHQLDAVRDSKNPGIVLRFDRDHFDRFLMDARNGRFDN
ncbi:DUF397 domain-containing protein [Umezawaea endophytica]|uniref:DUF397 domain-containing protein n=1 Tax=Umezawaea endophytica TaxID=1654476 RepID=A0A9X3AIU8_9PSEU|nr:DUF397 domain-containing protein [Umezawaea endophytica]MCS7481035.1 DUF397 domain-containing protein [Umezawaea endophytica]